jgi:hypothetical protein
MLLLRCRPVERRARATKPPMIIGGGRSFLKTSRFSSCSSDDAAPLFRVQFVRTCTGVRCSCRAWNYHNTLPKARQGGFKTIFLKPVQNAPQTGYERFLSPVIS